MLGDCRSCVYFDTPRSLGEGPRLARCTRARGSHRLEPAARRWPCARPTAALCGFVLLGIALMAPAAIALPPGVTPEAKAAIDRGLSYLSRTQHRQGYWANRGARDAYPVAMSGLATLALLMDGNTTTQGRYAPNVDRAAHFLAASAQGSGLIAQSEREPRSMYGHGFSMLALGQLYGMTEDARRSRELHQLLASAVELTSRSQSRDGGWIYTPYSGGDEGSVTITQVQALRSCRNAGIAVPKTVIDDAMDYLARSQNSDGGIRYTLRQRGGTSRPPITAAAVCCWFNAGQYGNPRAIKALVYCKRHIKPRLLAMPHFYYAHFYMAQALYISQDPDWDEYYSRLRDTLLTLQDTDGSWPSAVGDIYSTSVALVILQLPFNQLPIMQK